jgi:hypothetical protein
VVVSDLASSSVELDSRLELRSGTLSFSVELVFSLASLPAGPRFLGLVGRGDESSPANDALAKRLAAVDFWLATDMGDTTGVVPRLLKLEAKLSTVCDLRARVLMAGGEEWKFGVDLVWTGGIGIEEDSFIGSS